MSTMYKYIINIDYSEKGIQYNLKSKEYIFTDMIKSAYSTFKDTKELFEIEKKAISLMKKNGIRDLMIDIYIKREQEQLELFRYTKNWDGVTRRIYEVGEKYLTETDKDMKVADGLKLMKKDFLYCKEWMKETVLDLILDEKEEDIA